MSTAATARSAAVEQYTVADVVAMLSGAHDYWSSHQVECGDCRSAPGGICMEHDEDDRLAFLAGYLSDALEAAGEEVLAGLAGLARTARKERTEDKGTAGQVPAARGETR